MTHPRNHSTPLTPAQHHNCSHPPQEGYSNPSGTSCSPRPLSYPQQQQHQHSELLATPLQQKRAYRNKRPPINGTSPATHVHPTSSHLGLLQSFKAKQRHTNTPARTHAVAQKEGKGVWLLSHRRTHVAINLPHNPTI